MICQRCAKPQYGIHTCNPSELVRKLESRIAELELALNTSLEQQADSEQTADIAKVAK